MKKSSKNLTEGNIAKQLILFTLPILVGQIFQNLYNSVDSIVVGQAVGTTALAAVSASSDISHLLIGFFTGLSTGAGVFFSRCFGSKNYDDLHRSIHTAITFSLIVGISIAGIGILFTPQLLRLVDCPADVFLEAEQYLRVYLIGVLFTAIYNVCSGVLRAVGDSKSPFYFLIISSLFNIVLDVLFVVVLKMGVMGAAAATIIAQFFSVFLVARKMLLTDDVYRLVIKDLSIDRSLLKDILKLGLPAGVQTSLVSISNLFVLRYINSFGSAAMAGIGAAKKIDKFVGMAAQSVGLATATFVSQNLGAKKEERAFRGIRVSCIICLIYVVTVGIIGFIFARPLVSIFTPDPVAIGYGVSMVHYMMPLYFCQGALQVFSNAVRGFGKSFVVMLCGILGMIGCRQIFLAISMSISYRVEFIYLGYPIGWFCAAFAVITYYCLAIRRKYKKTAHALEK